MTQITLSPSIATFIDEAGALDSEIKRLTKQLESIKAHIKAQGVGDFGGFAFNAKVIESERVTTDWKAIAEHMGYSRQLFTAHTSSALVQSIRFSKV